MHAGDTVTDGDDLANFCDVGFGAEIRDLVLENCGDFRGAEFHPLSSLHCKLEFLQLRANGRIHHLAADFHDEATDEIRVYGMIDSHLFANGLLQGLFNGRDARFC